MAKKKKKSSKGTFSKEEQNLINQLKNSVKSGFDYQIGEYTPSDKPFVRVLQRDGMFEVRDLPLARFVTQASKVTNPGLPQTLEEGLQLKVPKLPIKIFNDLYYFFRHFYDTVMKTEVYVRVYFNPENKEYYLRVPTQYVSAGAADWVIDKEERESIPESHILVLQAHSHHNMFGSFSSTDDKDQQNLESLHLVIGHIFDTQLEYQLRFKLVDSSVNLKLTDVFEEEPTYQLDMEQFGDYKSKVHPLNDHPKHLEEVKAKKTKVKKYSTHSGKKDYRSYEEYIDAEFNGNAFEAYMDLDETQMIPDQFSGFDPNKVYSEAEAAEILAGAGYGADHFDVGH